MESNILGKRIKYLREKQNLTQIELSKLLNIGNTTLSQYESGQRVPSDEIKAKIADFFGVTIDYLLGRTDNPNPTEDSTIDDEIMAIMRDLGPDITLQFYELKGMSDEEKENLKIFLQGLKARRESKK